jgi:hypothetical protein
VLGVLSLVIPDFRTSDRKQIFVREFRPLTLLDLIAEKNTFLRDFPFKAGAQI